MSTWIDSACVPERVCVAHTGNPFASILWLNLCAYVCACVHVPIARAACG